MRHKRPTFSCRIIFSTQFIVATAWLQRYRRHSSVTRSAERPEIEDVDGTVANLSYQALLSVKALDELRLECDRSKAKAELKLQRIKLEASQISAEISGNLAAQTSTSASAETAQTHVDRISDEAVKAKTDCRDRLTALEKQVDTFAGDLHTAGEMEVAAGVCEKQKNGFVQLAQQVNCTSKGHALLALLGGVEAPKFLQRSSRRKAMNFASDFAKSALQETLERAYRSGVVTRAGTTGLGNPGDMIGEPGGMIGEPSGMIGETSGNPEISNSMDYDTWIGGKQPCVLDKTKEVQCSVLTKELGLLSARLHAKHAALHAQHGDLSDGCRSHQEQNEEALAQARRILTQTNEELSNIMATLADLQVAQDDNSAEDAALSDKMKSEDAGCKRDAAVIRSQIASALSVRQMVYQQDAPKESLLPPLQDCIVSDWTFASCSKECVEHGGVPGVQKGTRTVESNPGHGGMDCPSTEVQVSCNDRPCSVDCIMGEWSEWTQCSRECNGGTTTRQRHVEQAAENGGAICGLTTERQLCNVDSCDKDCELGDWTAWSPCSRACRYASETPVGQRHQRREVKGAAAGSGSCPLKQSGERLRSEDCNLELCPSQFTCAGNESKDVVMLLQNSAGADLAAQIELVQEIAKNTPGLMRIGVTAYGIGAKTLSPITADRAALFEALQAASAETTTGAPDLAKGEILTHSILQLGETGVNGVALIFTDGSTADPTGAQTAAQALRTAGTRILIGLVGDKDASAWQSACGLGGAPCAEHVEAFQDWGTVRQQGAGRVLAALCQQLRVESNVTQATT